MTSLLRRLTGPSAVRDLRVLPTRWACRRCIATESRTYDEALRLLATLPTNAAAKKLFGPGAQMVAHETGIKDVPPKLPAPHEAAIPEMLAWLTRAGINPRAIPLRAIHVAGSKGKGSTAAYAAAVLRAGMPRRRVGTYTSPHLVSVRERIALDGAPIDEELFAKYFFEVWDAVGCTRADCPGGGGVSGDDGLLRPFFFRFMTILALHTFAREGIKDVVLECGIGGKYDATNVLPASALSATVVTQISTDHAEMLGRTVGQVAWHKAGIFRKGVPAFVRPQDPPIVRVQRQRASEKGAVMVVVMDGEVRKWLVPPSVRPHFDAENRALAAAAALMHLRGPQSRPSEADVVWMTEAMDKAMPRGRWEVMRRGPATFYLDGAHTMESVAAAAKWFARASDPGRQRVLVFNQPERSPMALCRRLLAAFEPNAFDEAIFCRSEAEDVEGETALGLQNRMKRWAAGERPGMVVHCERGVRSALEMLKGREVDVLVTGSLYLVGSAIKVLDEDE